MAQSEASAGSFGPNAWLVDDMYDRFLVDPSSVSDSWREFFADYRATPLPAPQAVPVEATVVAPPPVTAARHGFAAVRRLCRMRHERCWTKPLRGRNPHDISVRNLEDPS